MGVLYAGGDIGEEIEGNTYESDIQKSDKEDINLLTKSRIEVLKATNRLADDVDMEEVEAQSWDYYEKALSDRTHTAYLVFDSNGFIGAGGISYYRVMPTYHNPSIAKNK